MEEEKPEVNIEESQVLPPEGEVLPEGVETAVAAEAEIDLDKRRDDRVFPVVKKVLEYIASDMIPEDANIQVDYNPVTLKILQEYVDADLNISTEMTYVSQVALNVLAGLNRTVQMCDFLPIDDQRYGTIGRKILQILSDANIPLGNLTPEQNDTAFAPVKEQLSALFAEEKLTWLEIKYVMDNIFDSYKVVNGVVGRSIEDSTALAEAKLFGLDTMNDLTLQKLDTILKA